MCVSERASEGISAGSQPAVFLDFTHCTNARYFHTHCVVVLFVVRLLFYTVVLSKLFLHSVSSIRTVMCFIVSTIFKLEKMTIRNSSKVRKPYCE